MNDIFNLIVHIVFLCIGVGVGFVFGFMSKAGQDVATDVAHSVEDRFKKHPRQVP